MNVSEPLKEILSLCEQKYEILPLKLNKSVALRVI